MNRIINWFKPMILLCIAALSTSAFADNLKIGDPAPEFRLIDQHQQTIQLSQFKNQWVVLYFYPKNDTPGCTTEACSFRDNINALIAQQAVVLGVSTDSKESHQAFAKKYALPFSLLSDPDAEVAHIYGAALNLGLIKFAKRHSFIINPQGQIAKIYREVDPDQHVREVMRDLKTLQSS